MPLPEELERVWVGAVVDKNDLIRFAKKVECDLLEDVLSSDVDQVKLNDGIRFLFDWHVLDAILTSLRHHVIMVKVLLCELVNDLCLSNGWFSRYYNSGSQNRHFVLIQNLNYK